MKGEKRPQQFENMEGVNDVKWEMKRRSDEAFGEIVKIFKEK